MTWKQVMKQVWLVVWKYAQKKAFDYADKDKDGKLSDEEIKQVVKEFEQFLKKLKKK
jgi:hypothetical protein